jgi:DNA-binding response OmpR family regulator
MELKARVQTRLKKTSTKVYAANLEVDFESHRAHLRSPQGLTEIVLTRTEFKILSTLIQSLDQVFSRDRLLSKVWGDEVSISDRVVDSHISHLRKKIAPAGISLESLRGEGYRMVVLDHSKIQATAA